MDMEKEQKDGVGLFVKVMSDEQLELLRRQISAYVVLSQQLADMHKSLASQQSLCGLSFGSIKYDPLMAYNGGHKMSSRQRWSPSPEQLQVLERIFEEGIGTPSKLKIKAITEELFQFGQISETNVYNWFQNRRARSKRKPAVTVPNHAESQPLHAKSDSSEFSAGHTQDHFYFPSTEELVSWPENLSVHELQQGLPSWSGF